MKFSKIIVSAFALTLLFNIACRNNDDPIQDELPKGAFLLNTIKKWYQLFKTGNTKHLGKYNRIVRVLEVFPTQKFILLGDNSQSDPEIYKLIADKFPQQIFAIYIRNISSKKIQITEQILESIENKEIYTLLYRHTSEAILHSECIGLIKID